MLKTVKHSKLYSGIFDPRWCSVLYWFFSKVQCCANLILELLVLQVMWPLNCAVPNTIIHSRSRLGYNFIAIKECRVCFLPSVPLRCSSSSFVPDAISNFQTNFPLQPNSRQLIMSCKEADMQPLKNCSSLLSLGEEENLYFISMSTYLGPTHMTFVGTKLDIYLPNLDQKSQVRVLQTAAGSALKYLVLMSGSDDFILFSTLPLQHVVRNKTVSWII